MNPHKPTDLFHVDFNKYYFIIRIESARMAALKLVRQTLRQMANQNNFDRVLDQVRHWWSFNIRIHECSLVCRNFQVNIVAFEPGIGLHAEMVVQHQHSNLNGMLHGGCASTLADKLSSLSMMDDRHSKQDDVGPFGSSIQLSVNFVKAAPIGTTLKIKATPLNVGSRLAHLHIEAFDKHSNQLIFTAFHIKSFK